jgi:hypothetical protein
MAAAKKNLTRSRLGKMMRTILCDARRRRRHRKVALGAVRKGPTTATNDQDPHDRITATRSPTVKEVVVPERVGGGMRKQTLRMTRTQTTTMNLTQTTTKDPFRAREKVPIPTGIDHHVPAFRVPTTAGTDLTTVNETTDPTTAAVRRGPCQVKMTGLMIAKRGLSTVKRTGPLTADLMIVEVRKDPTTVRRTNRTTAEQTDPSIVKRTDPTTARKIKHLGKVMI